MCACFMSTVGGRVAVGEQTHCLTKASMAGRVGATTERGMPAVRGMRIESVLTSGSDYTTH